jgi:hypothetical protein
VVGSEIQIVGKRLSEDKWSEIEMNDARSDGYGVSTDMSGHPSSRTSDESHNKTNVVENERLLKTDRHKV